MDDTMSGCRNEALSLKGKFSQSDEACLFRYEDHTEDVLENQRALYNAHMFCDVTLVSGIDGAELKAHRMVLSSASKYFFRMFAGFSSEEADSKFLFETIDGVTLKTLIDFIYTGSIELRNDTFESIIRAADLFQLHAIVEACCNFMCKRIDRSNCLGIAFFAEQYCYIALFEKAFGFACDHFEEICTEAEFLNLNYNQISKLLSSDTLCAASEEMVFDSILSWVKYDMKNRQDLTICLLGFIRFSLLNTTFLMERANEVPDDCHDVIINWLYWHLLPECRGAFSVVSSRSRELNRKPILVGGWDICNDLSAHTYNSEYCYWSFNCWPNSPRKRKRFGAVVFNNLLIVAGGMVCEKATNCAECFSIQESIWKRFPAMLSKRTDFGMAEVNGCLYAVGGYGANGCALRSVEKFDFTVGKWKIVASMPAKLTEVRTAVLNGLLYVVGNGNANLSFYDPINDVWAQKTWISGNREAFGMAAVGGYLYMVGGRDMDGLCPIIERFNPITSTWKVVNCLNKPRENINCIGVGNRLLACGGCDGRNWVNLMEEYNPKTNKCCILTTLLPATHGTSVLLSI